LSDVCHLGICDVLVVGSGHAAVEAALAAARMGVSVVLLTKNTGNIAGMPCNPAIGGPGKAQIVSEIDALGGEMALAADEATIQMRVLNSSKGPAVRSLRAQVDKEKYSLHMKRALERAGVRIQGGMATSLIVEGAEAQDSALRAVPSCGAGLSSSAQGSTWRAGSSLANPSRNRVRWERPAPKGFPRTLSPTGSAWAGSRQARRRG
jgi:glucose-inhibited division protein A